MWLSVRCIWLGIKTDSIAINVFICRWNTRQSNRNPCLLRSIPCLDLDKVHTYADWNRRSQACRPKRQKWNRSICPICLFGSTYEKPITMHCLHFIGWHRPKRFVNKNHKHIVKGRPMFLPLSFKTQYFYTLHKAAERRKHTACWAFYVVFKSLNLTLRQTTMAKKGENEKRKKKKKIEKTNEFFSLQYLTFQTCTSHRILQCI